MKNVSDIKSLPYEQRRILLIRPDTEEQEEESGVDWKTVGAIQVIGRAIPFINIAIAGYAFGKYVLDKNKKKQTDSFDGAIAVTAAVARQQLSFPPGHPLMNHAYVGHPLKAECYIPYSAFHRHLFEEKVAELISLLASLGATRTRVVCKEGYKKEVGLKGGAESPTEGGEGHMKWKTASTDEALFEEHFSSTGEPSIPSGLAWYGHEASWQAIAERRLKHGTTMFKVKLSYEDDFGVDANLKVKLTGCGFNLGGSFNEFKSTEWIFEGEFR